MLTPAILLAYYVTLGPVLALPVRPDMLRPPAAWVVMPIRPFQQYMQYMALKPLK